MSTSNQPGLTRHTLKHLMWTLMCKAQVMRYQEAVDILEGISGFSSHLRQSELRRLQRLLSTPLRVYTRRTYSRLYPELEKQARRKGVPIPVYPGEKP